QQPRNERAELGEHTLDLRNPQIVRNEADDGGRLAREFPGGTVLIGEWRLVRVANPEDSRVAHAFVRGRVRWAAAPRRGEDQHRRRGNGAGESRARPVHASCRPSGATGPRLAMYPGRGVRPQYGSASWLSTLL